MEQSLIERLRIRADIRRNAKGRKSVEEGKPDRIADLLEESVLEIERLERTKEKLKDALISLVQESDINNLKNMKEWCECQLKEQFGKDTGNIEISLFAINALIEVLEEENRENS